MAIEIEQEYGGTGSSFMSSTLTVEEIAKVDPSVSVLVDLQNTLGNNVMVKIGNKEQKEKYLPRLATNTVSLPIFIFFFTCRSVVCYFKFLSLPKIVGDCNYCIVF